MSLKQANDRTFGTFATSQSHIGKVLSIFVEDNNEDCVKVLDLLKGLGAAISVVRVNKKDSPQLIRHYRIVQFPTLILFKKGKAVSRIDGIPISELQVNTFTKELKEPKPQILITNG